MEPIGKDLYKNYYEKWIGENGVNAIDRKLNKSTQINVLNGPVRTNLLLLKYSNILNGLTNIQLKEEPESGLFGPSYELANKS